MPTDTQSTASKLAAYDAAQIKAAREAGALLPKAATPSIGYVGRVVGVRRGRIEAVSLATGERSELDDAAVAAVLGADDVAITNPTQACRLSDAVRTRARHCSDSVVAPRLWGLARYLDWLVQAAPATTLRTPILSRAMARSFWCGTEAPARLSSSLTGWFEAAGVAHLPLAERLARLVGMMPTFAVPASNHGLSISARLAYDIWKAEAQMAEAACDYRQTMDARMFLAGEFLVNAWESLDGIDPVQRDRHLIDGTVLAVVDGADHSPSRLTVRGSVRWHDDTSLYLAGGRNLVAPIQMYSASMESAGLQHLYVNGSRGWLSANEDLFVSVGAPYPLGSTYSGSKWFNKRYLTGPPLTRDVPLDVMLAGC